ncbi:hypothetical protein GCM10022384_53700 [Streptomyces marokkonensis]|uniref:Uncharacterized protein n=1 Tax=Streptomyces marokkonensis TaxID=324855 RepID=A0ABP7RN91_9ACTN
MLSESVGGTATKAPARTRAATGGRPVTALPEQAARAADGPPPERVAGEPVLSPPDPSDRQTRQTRQTLQTLQTRQTLQTLQIGSRRQISSSRGSGFGAGAAACGSHSLTVRA